MHTPPRTSFPKLCALALLLPALAACKREQAGPAPGAAPAPGVAAPAAAPTDTSLEDVTEHTADYIIGISYPPVASEHPALAAELKRYADAARAELVDAAAGRAKGGGAAPYELVLPFSEIHVSPTLVAVGVDGSSYTGGAHGAPLIARWVWLPRQGRLLRATDLVPEPRGWEAISRLVREQLHTALSQRLDADALPPDERVEILRDASRMIEAGTEPDPEHFSHFEPLVGSGGRIRALRFVFPPYQVGPYSDGTQAVEVPAVSLLPYIAPAYRSLFEGG